MLRHILSFSVHWVHFSRQLSVEMTANVVWLAFYSQTAITKLNNDVIDDYTPHYLHFLLRNNC